MASLINGCSSDSDQRGSLPFISVTAPASVPESDASVSFTLTLNGDTEVNVGYTTVLGSASINDLEPVTGSVRLSQASPSTTITLILKNDDLVEDTETFSMAWSTDVTTVNIPASSTVTLLDDDSALNLPLAGSFTKTGLFHPSTDCTNCHRASAAGTSPAVMRSGATVPESTGEDISPGNGWQHSLMAHSMNDPFYIAKVSDEVVRHPELKGFIEDKCLTCHAPMAHSQAHEDGRLAVISDSCPYETGCLPMTAAFSDPMSREGISCTLCHRIDGRVLSEERDSGRFPLTNSPLAPELFGPFTAPVTSAMENNLGIIPVYGEQMSKSEHCSSCHDLLTPVIDADTNEPNGNTFAEQTPYREWLNSDYARGQSLEAECQACHMPSDPAFRTRISLKPNGSVNTAWPERNPYSEHTFVGGNTHILKTLREYRSELGITAKTTEAGFDKKIAETRTLLGNTAELHIDNIAIGGGSLSTDIRIVNLSGHKLPTGYPSRRMWIALKVRDGSQAVIFSSGQPDEKGRLSIDSVLASSTCTALSAPASTCIQPHTDHASTPDDIPVYESVLGDTTDAVTHTLLHASHYLKDNRLPPIGFRTSSDRYDPLTGVIGVSGDADYNINGSGSDTVHYSIPTGTSTGPWTVEATLYLQAIRPDFIEALEPQTVEIKGFRAMMANVPPLPEILAEVSAIRP